MAGARELGSFCRIVDDEARLASFCWTRELALFGNFEGPRHGSPSLAHGVLPLRRLYLKTRTVVKGIR